MVRVTMRLCVIAAGNRMPKWVRAGWEEYHRRLPPHLSLDLIEISPAGRKDSGSAAVFEAAAMLKRAPAEGIRVALDRNGQRWSTAVLAGHLAAWQRDGGPVTLFIGGADGLDPSVIDTCQVRWSLGPLTLPHMLVRVILVEQLYRACTILAGHPYHRV